MGKQNQYIAQLEKLLTHLKNAKLIYLKAADEANASEEKRFFNQDNAFYVVRMSLKDYRHFSVNKSYAAFNLLNFSVAA